MSEFEQPGAIIDSDLPADIDAGLPAVPAALEKPDKKARDDKSRSDKENWADRKGRSKREQVEGIDDAIDKALERSAKANEGKDAAKAEREKARADKPRSSAKHSEDSEILGGILDRAFKSADGEKKPLDRKQFASNDFRGVRERIKHRYPDMKPSAYLAHALKLVDLFKRNPWETAKHVSESYAKLNPAQFQKFEAKKYGAGLDAAIDRAMDDRADWDDLADAIKEHGADLPEILRQAIDLEEALTRDPYGEAARLAANFGATGAEQSAQVAHSQQPQIPPERQQEYANVEKALHLMIQHANDPSVNMPGLDDAMMNDIAEAFETGVVPLTGDRMHDMQRGYSHVCGLRHAEQEKQKQSAAGKKSISGAPSTNTGRSRRGAEHSLDAALDRAFARM